MITMTLPASIKADDMRNLVNHFPKLLTTFQIDQITLDIVKDYSKQGIRGICFIGMGGSSIAGNYISALLSKDAQIPISVVRDYSIPAFVDQHWVVIAVSYSGNTEETITSLRNAREVGARIILITSGGMMAQEEKHPLVLIPKGLQPRATLPLMLSVALTITETLAGFPLSDFHMLEEVLTKRARTWNDWIQPPRKIAESFIEKIPLFIGAQHLTPVAYRAKCQINENSKALAFQSELPESNHNEIESFTSTTGCTVIPVFLRSRFESNKLAKRFEATYEIYHEMGLNPINLRVKDNTRLEEMLILTHFLDMVSLELADIRNVDPVSVEKITELKHRLMDD